MALTLTHSSTTQSLAAWGLSAPSYQLINQAPDTLNLTQDGAAWDSAALFAYLDPVTLLRDDVAVFKGLITTVPRSTTGLSESIAYRASGPWWYLTQGQYTQSAAHFSGGVLSLFTNCPQVTLFSIISLGVNASPVSVGGQIASIVAACNSYHGGSKLQLGTLSGGGFSVYPLPKQLSDATFEQALRECLRYVPDAVTSWDYTTTPPTLHITQHASATPVTLDSTAGTLTDGKLTPRPDLQLAAVQLTYITSDSAGRVTITQDAASGGPGYGTLAASMELKGGEIIPAQTESVDILSEAIDESDPAWWAESSGIEITREEDILVGAGTVMEFDADAPENAGASGLDGCERRLIRGAPGGWQGDDHFRIAKITGYLNLRHWIDPDERVDGTDPYRVEQRTVVLRVPVTDLNGTYTHTTQSAVHIPGETPPTGVAAAILTALSVLHYQGSFQVTQSEATFAIKPGNTLNLTNGLTAWATMAAQVQSVEIDAESGRTTITIGPPEHLGPADYLELARSLRRQPVGEAPNRRVFGVRNAVGTQAAVQHPGPWMSRPAQEDGYLRPEVITSSFDTYSTVEVPDAELHPFYIKPISGKMVLGTVRGDIIPRISGDYISDPAAALTLSGFTGYVYLKAELIGNFHGDTHYLINWDWTYDEETPPVPIVEVVTDTDVLTDSMDGDTLTTYKLLAQVTAGVIVRPQPGKTNFNLTVCDSGDGETPAMTATWSPA